ncbi:alanine racemase [Vagococcus xieshaowenii]|uniref:Alanine racemase n=1 Tax=Vagococcus xieshaowenii TaxID=2562451 RepID=A0AAJ5EH35_9ENTE|nr:alanine racemase [Vagococcus xieshaowenii]QCA29587.1 alanine racemase [Vagococcus xieshaowenii]TFZ42883.1 alanine racemase [Vagococcus xieshaowenii]
MVTSWNRPTTLIVNKKAIQFNIAQEQKRLKSGQELFAVIKADAYGHGAIEVAKTALLQGVNGFCVSNIDEAVELREAGILLPILILGVVSPTLAPLAQQYDLTLTVANEEWLRYVATNNDLDTQKAPLKVHLKIDTGMHRIGFNKIDDMVKSVQFIQSHPLLTYEGIFTHFATADEEDTTYFDEQVATFTEFVKKSPVKPKYIHCANSATAIWHEDCPTNIVRLGIGLYGLNPSGDVLSLPYELKPAASLTTELVFVKQLHVGDKVSYGATYQASEDEWIGTLPIGYADGWNRKLQGFKVLVDGNYCEIIGRVCMDQCMIRLPKYYSPGTTVTLMGEDNGQVIDANDIAHYLETISYEVLCGISTRIPRKYV